MAEQEKQVVRTAEEILAMQPSDAETLPDYMVEPVDVDYKAMLVRFQDRASFVDGVRKEALIRTRPQHWLARRDMAGNMTYSLMSPGAERIKTLCPIGFANIQRRKEKWRKEAGEGYTWIIEAEVYLGTPRSGTLPVVGSCASDKDFFATEHVSLPYNPASDEHKAALESGEGRLSRDQKTLYIRRSIPSSEIDEAIVLKNALSNLIVNGVTRVLGIRAISEQELAEVGIDTNRIPVAEYGSKKTESGRLSPAEEQRRGDIWRMLLEMNGGDEAKARAALKARSAFGDREGVEDVGRLTAKQIAFHFDKVSADHGRWRGEPKGQAAPPAKAGQAAKPAQKAKEPDQPGQAELL